MSVSFGNGVDLGNLVTATSNPLTGGSTISYDGGFGLDITFENALSRYGAVLSGASDDSASVQSAIDYMAATYARSKPKLPFGSTLLLNSGLTIDATKGGIDFAGARIVPVGAITALTITSADVIPDFNNISTVENFEIDGDLTVGQRGIYFNKVSGSGYGPSRIMLRNYTVKQCDVGFEIGNNTYLMASYGFHIAECNTGIKSPNGQTNSYELPVFYNGVLGNNVLGMDVADGQLTFIGSSIDYNRKHGSITGGRVLLNSCHIESNLKRDTYSAGQVAWSLSGVSSLIVQGGRMIFTPGSSGNDLDYIFDCNTPSNYDAAGVFIDRATLERCSPLSGYMAKGTGDCYVTRCIAKATTPMPKGVHESKNKLDFGTFEGGIFPTDNVFVSAGGSSTSRTASTNVTITQGAGAARSGSNGLIITKNTAAGASGSADVCIFADIDDSSSMHTARLWYKAPSSTAQVTIQFGYFAALPKVAGSDVYFTPTDTDTMTIAPTQPTTLSGTWTEVTVPIPYRRPKPGMRYVGFRIRVHALGAGEAMYVDDVEIHSF